MQWFKRQPRLRIELFLDYHIGSLPIFSRPVEGNLKDRWCRSSLVAGEGGLNGHVHQVALRKEK